jgi:hypothetical protein
MILKGGLLWAKNAFTVLTNSMKASDILLPLFPRTRKEMKPFALIAIKSGCKD